MELSARTQAPCAGVDASRNGWVIAWDETPVRVEIVSDFVTVVARTSHCKAVAVDMPIGLLQVPQRGGRPCDRLARALLGRRASTVFSPPARLVASAASFREANAVSKLWGPGITVQAWNIVPRILEVDACLRETPDHPFSEAHPELAFLKLHGAPLDSKHRIEGRRLRATLLAEALGPLPDVPQAIAVDALDAMALLLTARSLAAGDATILGGQRDPFGLPMAIAY